ncbi:PREDICTED: rasGAP-activating-like protein 1 [Aptenodytes forsteri]|uniref:rasGAP-activating-like protein 1 n=1 Tax=Aptenodytes forsteri TaxID=9233 RepID=UPI0004F4862D|nr:PREDICTED: rasGAP-activating-like protein 1 [Aptenodytes forsteri]
MGMRDDGDGSGWPTAGARKRSGSSDPYCVVKVDNEVVARTATVWKSLNPAAARRQAAGSGAGGTGSIPLPWQPKRVIKKTRFPHWDEVLEFELAEGETGEAMLSVEVWDWDIVGKNDFLGRVEFPLDTIRTDPTKGWFQLLPFPSTTEDHGGQLGALRLVVRLVEDRVLPPPYYQPLIQLLTEPILCPNVLKPVVNRIFEEKKYVELDPGKMELSRSRRISFKGSMSEARVRESSLELLKGYLGDIVDAIVGSVEKCPLIMRVAFKHLRRRVEERFPSAQHEEVRYFSISGFLFLRFFAPAILTPKLFSLREQHADTRTGRTLLLLAKALQSIGNLGLQLGQGKEPWMAPLHAILLPSVTRVKAFLDGLVEVESAEAGEGPVPLALFRPSATIKEGYLHTRTAGGPVLLPRFAFKKRYFWLSSEALTYAKSPEWQVRCSIPVPRMRAVEQVDEGTFQHPHSGQELWQWLWAVRQASSTNEAMLPTCHPGTFRAGRWTCCLQPACTGHG